LSGSLGTRSEIERTNKKTWEYKYLCAGDFSARQSAEICNAGLAFQNREQINDQ
jgi:hypothetical protein